MKRTTGLLLLVLALFAAPTFAANIIINNVDAPGVGFNDTTPATPVGGNPGTTLGEQRLNVFEFAGDLWGAVLQSNVTIVVQATFQPLGCTPNSGTLGAAGTIQIFSVPPSFPVPGIIPDTWYHTALLNSRLGFDAAPGPPDPGLLLPPFADDIVTFFNGAIGTDPNCLTGLDWYNGFDNNQAGNEIDLLGVLMHELGHGLGFSEFASEGTGSFIQGRPGIYARNMFDNTLGLNWDQMTNAQRLASQVNTGNLVWAGAATTAAAPLVLGARSTVDVLVPPGFGTLDSVQPASFGPPIQGGGGTTGKVELVDDGAGVGSDGCQPIVNNVSGKIALIDRGACAFVTKVLNAQAAGAKGVMIANNQPSGPAPMGGSNPFVTIPSAGITRDEGDAFKDVLANTASENLEVNLVLDPSLLAGGDANGRVRLYAPNPVAPGSSKSHWDTVATPNLLMEPFINSDLAPASDLDLTPFLFSDIGWLLLP